MGAVFADRLMAAGHEIAVWNRSPEKAASFAARGAVVAASPADLVGKAEVILVIVSDDGALAEVFDAPDGLLSGTCAGKLFVEMSTVRPATHVELAGKVQAAGGSFMECPVGGSVAVAREGRLLGFAGGAPADVDRVREVLSVLCRRIDHVGPIGAGASLKLAINLPLLVYWQALGEALALADGCGFDPNWLIEMFSESSGGPNVLKVRGPGIAKSLSGESVPVSADLNTMRKDLGLMLEEARAKGRQSPLVERVYANFGKAQDQGLGGLDCSAYPAYWAKQASTQP